MSSRKRGQRAGQISVFPRHVHVRVGGSFSWSSEKWGLKWLKHKWIAAKLSSDVMFPDEMKPWDKTGKWWVLTLKPFCKGRLTCKVLVWSAPLVVEVQVFENDCFCCIFCVVFPLLIRRNHAEETRTISIEMTEHGAFARAWPASAEIRTASRYTPSHWQKPDEWIPQHHLSE